MLKKWIQANLIVMCSILFFVLMAHVNPDIEFIVSPWWAMLIPNATFVFSIIMMKIIRER